MTLGPLSLLLFMLLYWPTMAKGAGTLAPAGGYPPIHIQEHHVDVVINNGFAVTEVTQTFINPYDVTLEATYAFPAPRDATLADVEIITGETILRGEVVAKEKARSVYQQETAAGNDAGLAETDEDRQFRFHVYPIHAGNRVVVRFSYYQPLRIDSGVGRYVYPLEEGKTEVAAESFWRRNSEVQGKFSVEVNLHSSYPLADVRAPGLESAAQIECVDSDRWRLSYATTTTQLDRDFVLYYRLQDNLPGRVELLTYKQAPQSSGTFMLVVTPGMDLKPLEGGADYLFVLDVSGSMESKLQTLANGVAMALGELRPQDRYRIITFSDRSADLTNGWRNASPESVERTLKSLSSLRSGGGTNLEAGIRKALRGIDERRVTSMVLVTDGVANLGNVSPGYFHKLLSQYDLRLFGFLMGNNANFPLMEILCDATGGYFSQVSNQDDIIGQILMAKGKVTHQAIQDVEVSLASSEVTVEGLAGDSIGKIFLGQQLVLFGQFQGSGNAILELRMRVSGEDRDIKVPLHFPSEDLQDPELERLWALQAIQDVRFASEMGFISEQEARNRVRDLGIQYQIVTDETSMVVLADEGHLRHGIERRNAQRMSVERQAQSARLAQAPRDPTQASGGALGSRSTGDRVLGGGSLDKFIALIALGLLLGISRLANRD